VFDVTPSNFRWTDWRPGYFILYQRHIQEKSRKGGAMAKQEFFYDSSSSIGGLLFLQAQYEG